MKTRDVLDLVESELTRASVIYPPIASAHEGIAIIEEEFLELRAEVFIKSSQRRPEDLRKEAKHLAAMAIRFMVDLT